VKLGAERGKLVLKFDDEPLILGENLPIRPGHNSPGRLERVLRSGGFAVTAEISPPDSADPREVYERAAVFDGVVDAMNATDGAGANCHMSSVGMCSLLTRRGYAMVMQVSCRDRNRIAIQGDVLGASAMGVSNVLCLTGDGVQVGDHPEAKPVFDLDCMAALSMLRNMRDNHCFMSGREITSPPKVFLGAVANPFAPPLDYRPLRLAKKITAGAQFIQTQYCYDIKVFEHYMKEVRREGLHEEVFILPGVGPLASARTAQWIRSNVPGVHIPDAVINRLKNAKDQTEEGIRICVEMIQMLKEIEGIHGVHIMAYRHEHRVAEVVERSGVLEDRVPWHPGLAVAPMEESPIHERLGTVNP
jgi:methylenetetrahydrofolate reductase (NADPH)|tara:strand:+ start:2972 stop:4051 length:1080 start_codon:yes stop_codon:yes gene_type:complete